MKQMKRRGFIKGGVAASALAAAPFNILKAGEAPNRDEYHPNMAHGGGNSQPREEKSRGRAPRDSNNSCIVGVDELR
ncbi:MAG: hypothetical protein ACQESR_06220 [Planctomycetota bacterium]